MHEQKNDKITNFKGIISAKSSVGGSLEVAHYCSREHIQSAFLFSRLSAKIEKNHVGTPSEELKIENKAHVIAAIFTAVSFIESIINEFFWDLESPNKVEALEEETKKIMANMWGKGIKKTSTLEKYQFALALARKSLFDRGIAPYQDVSLLIRLRNALIHYEPEWVGDSPQKLEENLKGKFELSPFYGEGSLFIPHRCLSHGCAKWVAINSLKFTDDFFARMGLEPGYDYLRSKLITE